MNESLIEKIGELVAGNDTYHRTTGDQASYNEFIDQFPVSSLAGMSLDDYCLGHGCKAVSYTHLTLPTTPYV